MDRLYAALFAVCVLAPSALVHSLLAGELPPSVAASRPTAVEAGQATSSPEAHPEARRGALAAVDADPTAGLIPSVETPPAGQPTPLPVRASASAPGGSTSRSGEAQGAPQAAVKQRGAGDGSREPPASLSLAAPVPATAPRQPLLLPVLMYHHVRPIDFKTADALASSLTLPPAEFEKQMRFLGERGFKTVRLSEVARALSGQLVLPPRSVVLTFDDGYLDNYQHALPALKARGFSGTFFVITGLVGEDDYMSWEQISEMSRGGMEIGSHTINHPDLRYSAPSVRDRELAVSKRRLEEATGQPVAAFAYPSGAHSADAVAAVRKAGYSVAVTTRYGALQDVTRPLEMPRVRIQGTDGLAAFRWTIEQFFPAGR